MVKTLDFQAKGTSSNLRPEVQASFSGEINLSGLLLAFIVVNLVENKYVSDPIEGKLQSGSYLYFELA